MSYVYEISHRKDDAWGVKLLTSLNLNPLQK